ncbi:MAG: tRNA1(Val) (adenine(37)-N6)-methyltransferase [Lachnospiraceae bacterium]|nr:tRNA1(Val) (adenine(37)-N6)-methyltransferase [Lachnospiraceae bacterium]
MDEILLPGERIDDLERNNFKIIQNPARFCFGMDAVLLSGFAFVREGESAIDLGTGNGIIPILLAAKTPGKHFTGLEIQHDNVEMAQRSVRLNHIEDRVDIVEGDIKTASADFGKASFEVVTSNPPYMIGSHGLVNPDSAKALARHEILCTLEDVVREAALLLKPQGRFYLVHRPFRLAEIMVCLKEHRLEPKRMKLVHPFIDKEPNMVLVEAVRGGKSRMTVEPPLIVYKEEGVYNDEIYDIYGY